MRPSSYLSIPEDPFLIRWIVGRCACSVFLGYGEGGMYGEQVGRDRGLGNVAETYNDGLIPLCGLGVLIVFDAGEGAVAHLFVKKVSAHFATFE